MHVETAAVETARTWIPVGEVPSARGEASPPRVLYVHEPHGNAERMRVEIEYRLVGYWISRRADGCIVSVDVPGGRVLDRPGVPRVPAVVFSVALPFGARFDPATLDVDVVKGQVAAERMHLRPVPHRCIEGMRRVAEPDRDAFERQGWFPPDAALIREAPALEGIGRLAVRINPVAYEPISGRLMVRHLIHARLTCPVLNHGIYDEDSVDLLSPVLRTVLGSQDLIA